MNKHRDFEDRIGKMLADMLKEMHYYPEVIAESGVVTVRAANFGDPDFQIRVTALDPELSGGFGISPATLEAVSDLMELEAVTDGQTDRRDVGVGETDDHGFGYQIGTGVVSGRSATGYYGVAT